MSLTAGVLDGAAQHAFTYGACAGLAIAVHDATGWPLVKITDAHSVYTAAGLSVEGADPVQRAGAGNVAGMGAGGLHWAVLHPSGQLLDVDGLHDAAELVEGYDMDADEGGAAAGRTTRQDAYDEYVEAKGEPVPLRVCATFVRAVLAKTESVQGSEQT